MKKISILLGLLFVFGANAHDLAGAYEASYKSLFKTETMDITLEDNSPRFGEGFQDLNFYSKSLGECSSNKGASSTGYSYKVSNDIIPYILKSEKKVTFVQGTIFCKDGWYLLTLELPQNAFSNSDEIEVGLMLQTNTFKKLVEKKVTLRKLK